MWFTVQHEFASHPKASRAGNAALGLWVRAGAWSQSSHTSGHVPHSIVRMLGTTRQAARLVECGLWTLADDGYQFHQWDEHQQPKRLATPDEMPPPKPSPSPKPPPSQPVPDELAARRARGEAG